MTLYSNDPTYSNIKEEIIGEIHENHIGEISGNKLQKVLVDMVDDTASTVSSYIGDLSYLQTEDKSNIVSAVNEITANVADKADDNTVVHNTGDETINGYKKFKGTVSMENRTLRNIGTPSQDGDAVNKKYVDDKENALSSYIGNLSQLNTTDKSNIVAAVNEVVSNIPNLNIENGSGPNSIVQKGGNNNATASLSMAIGINCSATGERAFAQGNTNTAAGNNSHAEGGNTQVISSAYRGHAEGNGTTVNGTDAHAEGVNTTAGNTGSHAEGYSTNTRGVYSHAEGVSNLAIGRGSHVEGKSCTTDTDAEASHAEGINTITVGIGSHAEGYYTRAVGTYSHAEGESTQAGHYSHAEGYYSNASGVYSHAEGYYAESTGSYSHAEGYGTITNNIGEHAEGKYNKSNENTIHSVGIGSSDLYRKNAIEVATDGSVYIKGIGDYDGTNPSTDKSLQTIITTITQSLDGVDELLRTLIYGE